MVPVQSINLFFATGVIIGVAYSSERFRLGIPLVLTSFAAFLAVPFLTDNLVVFLMATALFFFFLLTLKFRDIKASC